MPVILNRPLKDDRTLLQRLVDTTLHDHRADDETGERCRLCGGHMPCTARRNAEEILALPGDDA